MKNQYEYLTDTHDLKSLSDWGPFARDIYALSHITDRERGLKFDFFFVPGILRRSFFMPETLRECGCSPMEAAPDLSYFSNSFKKVYGYRPSEIYGVEEPQR